MLTFYELRGNVQPASQTVTTFEVSVTDYAILSIQYTVSW
jgi:hypothetical protein